jgi:molecular chaperone DnaK (HSP70)
MARHRPPAVGVDFGTTTSLVAQRQGSGPLDLLPIGTAQRWLPSLVGRRNGRLVVGEDATDLSSLEVIRSIKRAITFDQTTVSLGTGEELSRDDVIVAVLRTIGERSAQGGVSLERQRDLRIGCPAMWRREQRQLLLDLVEAAGIDTGATSLVEEPVAAGLAWLGGGAIDPRQAGGRLLVFDMGGGTLDIAVLDIVPGDPPSVRVLTSTGLPVAGDALDEAIAEDLAAEVTKHGVDLLALKQPQAARDYILGQARAAKVLLSTEEWARATFSRVIFGAAIPPVRYERERLEAMFLPQLRQAEEKVWDALRLARLSHVRNSSVSTILKTPQAELAADVDHVLLAGGMSRIPAVRRRLAELLPNARIHDSVGSDVAADETVVAGLVDTGDADPINLYRPCFDFTLSWDGDGHFPLYEAYTPLFETYQLATMNEPSYVKTAGHRDGVPQQRQGELRVFSATGVPVNIERFGKDGTVQDVVERLPVKFGHRDVTFRLYTDGRVILFDGAGHSHTLRVEPWPAIEGAGSRPEPEDRPDPKVYYPFNKP